MLRSKNTPAFNAAPVELIGAEVSLNPNTARSMGGPISRRDFLKGAIGLGAVLSGVVKGDEGPEANLRDDGRLSLPFGSLQLDGWRVDFVPQNAESAHHTAGHDAESRLQIVMHSDNFDTVAPTLFGPSQSSSSSGALSSLEMMPINFGGVSSFWLQASRKGRVFYREEHIRNSGRQSLASLEGLSILTEDDEVRTEHLESLQDMSQAVNTFGTYHTAYITNPSQPTSMKNIYSGIIPERRALVMSAAVNPYFESQTATHSGLGLSYLFGAVRYQHDRLDGSQRSAPIHPLLNIESYLEGYTLRNAVNPGIKDRAWNLASALAVMRCFPAEALEAFRGIDGAAKDQVRAELAVALDFIGSQHAAGMSNSQATELFIPEISAVQHILR